MALLDELREMGVDVDEGVERMMGNSSLYRNMLVKFWEMVTAYAASVDFESGDYSKLIDETHKLKGASGNLSIVPLYEAYSEMVSLLRDGKAQQAAAVYRRCLPVQDRILGCIQKAEEGQGDAGQ